MKTPLSLAALALAVLPPTGARSLAAAQAQEAAGNRLVVALEPGLPCRRLPEGGRSVTGWLGLRSFPQVLEAPRRRRGVHHKWVLTEVNSKNCFLPVDLVAFFDPDEPGRAMDALARHALSMDGASFGHLASVHRLLERDIRENFDHAGPRLWSYAYRGVPRELGVRQLTLAPMENRALLRLRELQLLQKTAQKVSWCNGGGLRPCPPEHADWIELHRDRLLYNEPAAHWMVDPDRFWDLHDRHRDDPLADEIAWAAASIHPPGECEGHIPCYLGHQRGTGVFRDGHIEYLRRHPRGERAVSAMMSLEEMLAGLLATKVTLACHYGGFEPEAYRESAEAVGAVVDAATNIPNLRHRLRALLAEIARPCLE